MTLLILSHRIADGFSALIRPLRSAGPETGAESVCVFLVPRTGFNRLDVDAMRRMW